MSLSKEYRVTLQQTLLKLVKWNQMCYPILKGATEKAMNANTCTCNCLLRYTNGIFSINDRTTYHHITSLSTN